MHRISSDATNSGVFKRSKVQGVCVASSMLRSDFHPSSYTGRTREHVSTIKTWGDVQLVQDGTGGGCHSLITKQLDGLGVKHWGHLRDKAPASDCELHAFVFVSDSGPDQLACQAHVGDVCAAIPRSLFVPSVCFMHLLQLVIKSGLVLADAMALGLGLPSTYFSGIAKTMNLWRDTSNTKKVHKQWVARYGYEGARKYAQRIPPRAISDRWGSVDACELVLLEPPRPPGETAHVAEVLVHVFGPHAAESLEPLTDAPARDAPLAKREDDMCEGTVVEPTAVFKKRRGKWSRDVVALLSQPLFFFILKVVHDARQPIMRCFRSLQPSQAEVQRDDQEQTPLSKLVCGKAREHFIMCETCWHATPGSQCWTSMRHRKSQGTSRCE